MDWSKLPDDIVALVASSGRLVAQDLHAMRGVCRGWLSALPATGGQWLVMSRVDLERGRKSASIWAISAAGAGELVPVKTARLPVESSCWGSSRGWLAMRSLDGELFLHRPVGGEQSMVPPHPERLEPEGIFLRPPIDLPGSGWPVFTHGIFGSLLYFHDDAGPWQMAPVDDLDMVRTVALTTYTVYAASYPDRFFFDAYIPDPRNPPTSTVELGGLKPWLKNGHHLFCLDGHTHLCVLGRPENDEDKTVALLFLVEYQAMVVPELSRRYTIGRNSLFLGANQAILCPSHDEFVGRRPDTIYVEHNDGNLRRPELLMIHLGTQDVQTIPYPSSLEMDTARFGPASWVHPWAS